MHRPLIALALLGLAFAAAAATQPAPDPGAAADDGNGWLDSILGGLGDMMGTETRGERNRNPGNIRLGANWQGAVPGTDPAFVTFDTPENGIRALTKLLKNYQVLYGLRTVRSIITRYAPPSENNTSAYVAAVAGSMGISADDPLNLNDAGTLQSLVAAVITHENGRNTYAASTIAAGVALA